MPQIQIRPAVATDLPTLMMIDHSCASDYVWQMDIQRENGQIGIVFREIRLPRSVNVPYPRSVSTMADEWSRRSGILVAAVAGQSVGYLRLSDKIIPQTAWITDVVIAPRFRRQGIAATLILAGQSWALERKNARAVLELPSKCYPAICLAQKMGYEFCGYNDHYYSNKDIALFFGKALQ